MNHCLRHYEEPIADRCRDCQHPYCVRCLVYSFGPKKPPLCVSCALHAGGVRAGQRPNIPAPSADIPVPATLDKRTARALKRAEKDALKAAAKAAKRSAKSGHVPAAELPQLPQLPPPSGQVPAPSELLAGGMDGGQRF